MSKYQKVHGSKGPMNFVEPSLVETLQFLVLSFASSMERWVKGSGVIGNLSGEWTLGWTAKKIGCKIPAISAYVTEISTNN